MSPCETLQPSVHVGPLRVSSAPRLPALDYTKGVLVLFMVVYHGLNYSTDRTLSFHYLAFLPPSFIIITGFLVSKVYRGNNSGARADLHRYLRLEFRGLRLLLLFTLLNVVALSLIHDRARGQMPGLDVFWDEWFGVYVTGNARLATFEVLLPIAYFLLLAPILLLIARLHRLALIPVCVALIAAVAWREQHGLGWASFQLASCGLAGVVLGCFPLERLRAPWLVRILSVLAYAGYVAMAQVRGQTYLMQMLGGVLALAVIYSFCTLLPERGWWARRLELLGRYSLIAYIVQIVFLYALAHFLGRPEPFSLEFLGLFAGGLLLTQATVEVLDWLRSRSRVSDTVYKAVFA